ncbi:hypothetical protein KEM52_006033 [Ascosphaera acerosa]|nr:hypothetical protein KEM52_006033 [Ascosphaera acerosa]
MVSGTLNDVQRSKSGARGPYLAPHAGPKKLVVKNLASRPKIDTDAYLERIWVHLDEAMTAVFGDQKSRYSTEQLYREVETLCRLGMAEKLLARITAKVEAHLKADVLPQLQQKAADSTSTELLRAVEQAWTQWNKRLTAIRAIFFYLNQAYLIPSRDHAVLKEQGTKQFRTLVYEDAVLKDEILTGVCAAVDDLRWHSDSTVDLELLSSILKMFHQMGVYYSQFERCFYQHSRDFCHAWLEADGPEGEDENLASHVEQLQGLFDSEMERCDALGIDRSTRQGLRQLMDSELIAYRQKELLEPGAVVKLLRDHDTRTLAGLYQLLQQVSCHRKLRTALKSYLLDTGSELVLGEIHDVDMIESLLRLKAAATEVLKDCFADDSDLREAAREAFDEFLNKPLPDGVENRRPGQLLARHVDHILRGGWRSAVAQQGKDPSEVAAQGDDEAEIDAQLDDALALFRHIHGKAVFEALYKDNLARRLLMNRSINDHIELSMLGKLRQECGSQFTQNLEDMFKDMRQAREVAAAYSAAVEPKGRGSRHRLELNAYVLSASAWPAYPDVDLRLPPQLDSALKNFEAYYESKHAGRKLAWKHSLAYSQLRARFPSGDKELVVSAYQTLVLLLFNDVPDGESLTYRQIRDALNLPDVEVCRTLQSLACAQYRVLAKTPKGRDVHETDTFCYNKEFTSDKYRIKISQVQAKEPSSKRDGSQSRVTVDRHTEAQAAIVQILKGARESMPHAELVTAVIRRTQKRGLLDVSLIKKAIASLIDKEYIERCDQNSYKYLP